LTITGNVTVTGLVDDANGLVLEGQLATPGGVPAATYGTFWVDDTGAPSLPKFTDDAGTTITLGAGGGTGDVVGPGGATNDAVARYDTATGKLIQDSVLIVTDAGAVSGATTYNGVTVETHATRHENGGADELSVAGLSGVLADNQNPVPTAGADITAIHDNVASEIFAIAVKGSPTASDLLLIEDVADSNNKKSITLGTIPAGAPAAHAASHENGGSDEISVLGLSGLLADNQNPVPTAGADITAIHNNVASEISAIANKAAAVGGDFLLIEDSAAANVKKHLLVSGLPPATPAAHAASHENGGGDEISVAGLSGLLADNQNPTSHAASHENGGGDEISVAGLSGLLADNQNPVPTAGVDTTAIHDNVASEISVIANKAVPAAGDFLLIEDSAAANVKKHILISSLPSGSVTNLQTAYEGGNTLVMDVTNGDFDVSGTQAISLDASLASNFTVTGANLTLATATSGGVLITGADGTAPGTVLLSSGNATGAGNNGADLSATSGDGSVGSGNAGGDAGDIQGVTGDGGAGPAGGAFDGGAAGSYQWAAGTGGIGGGVSGTGGAGGGFGYVAGTGGNATAGNSTGGAGGGFSFTAGTGGNGIGLGAGGAPGGFTFTTGVSGTGAGNTTAGDFTFTGADAGGTGGSFFANMGDALVAAGIGGEISLTAGNNDVATASGTGGAITATAGSLTDENSTGNGGDIDLISGSARLGTPGTITLQTGTHDADTGASISLLTEGLSGPIRMRTSTGFAGTECEHLTFGSQESVGAGGTNTIVNLGTLDTNGRNMMLSVTVTAQDNVTDANFASAQFVQSFYRAGATITALAAHQSDNKQSIGWSSVISFSIVPVLTSIELRITNASGGAEVGNVAVCWTRQMGGFST
jgi:hypothetical protein